MKIISLIRRRLVETVVFSSVLIGIFLLPSFAFADEKESEERLELAYRDSGRYSQEDADREDYPPPQVKDEVMETDEETGETRPKPSIASQILLYIPNRIFDVFDIVRVRARVGPGVAAGVRVTKYLQAYLGAYGAIYGGLPGPRLRTTPRSPIGLETNTGITLSVLDATIDGGFGPNYSPSEIGAGVQIGILGVDIGIDPVEILDLVAGILTLDIRDDDFK